MKTTKTAMLAALALAGGTAQWAVAQDDHGDTSAEATLLAVGGSVGGSLQGDDDTDFFRLDLIGLAEIQVRTSGQTDTEGELLDASGARLMSDDDSGPGDNFDIRTELQPGVYYVAVSGEAGGYAITARLGGARDHGDTPEASTLLRLHTPEDLASVSPNVLLATAARIHPDTVDRDVFRIDVAEDGADVMLRTSPSAYVTYGVLTDARGNQIATDDDGEGGFRLGATLDRGIYYTSVTGLQVGAYRILAQMRGAVPPGGSSNPTGPFTDSLSSGGEGPEMIVIPAGSFRMGCSNNDGDCQSREFPVHDVSVRRFALSKYEITLDQWDACTAAGGCGRVSIFPRPRGDQPFIASTNWLNYIDWLSAQTGAEYRLPTEAEWEYAARAGTTTRYHWGDEIGVNNANCDDCRDDSVPDDFNYFTTLPVGSFSPNAWGLYDMLGNAREWVEDCYHDSYDGAPNDGSAWTLNCSEFDGLSRVLFRGGNSSSSSADIRVSARGSHSGVANAGLRVARTLP